MKKTNLSIISLFLIFLAFSCKSTQQKNNKDNVIVIIENDWNEKMLDSVTEMLTKKRIKFVYNLKAIENGKITGLSIDVNTKDGYSGSANIDPFEDGYLFGFYRVYDKKAEKQFAVGVLNGQLNKLKP